MEDAEGDADATFIWGTNLSVSRVQSRFTSFIKTFRLPEEFDPKYLQLLQEVCWRRPPSAVLLVCLVQPACQALRTCNTRETCLCHA